MKTKRQKRLEALQRGRAFAKAIRNGSRWRGMFSSHDDLESMARGIDARADKLAAVIRHKDGYDPEPAVSS